MTHIVVDDLQDLAAEKELAWWVIKHGRPRGIIAREAQDGVEAFQHFD